MEEARKKILDDLSRYQKSYKFLVYKAFLAVQNNGVADEQQMMEYIRNFYLNRKQQGLKVETEDSAAEINEIKNTDLTELQEYIERMPLDRLNTLYKKELVEVDREIWDRLDHNDLEIIHNSIENKLVEYYRERVEDKYTPEKFNYESQNYFDEKEKLIFRKQVDWSVFKYGITIPQEYHDSFYQANDEELTRGGYHSITLLIDGEEYKGQLRNVDRNTKSDTLQIRYDGNSDLKNYLADVFKTTYQHLQKQRQEENSNSNKQGSLEKPAVFIEFYDTNEPYKYKIKLNPAVKDSPNIWWVNQGQTLSEEKEEGILWAPVATDKGSSMYHWETMKEVESDDIILHYANGALRYVSKVQEPAIKAEKPVSLQNNNDNWQRKGRLIKTKYYKLEPAIDLDNFSEVIVNLQIDKGPINRNGRVNQGYLFYFNQEGLKIIQESQPETEWPEFTIIDNHLLNASPLSTTEILDHIKSYIKNKGFNYPQGIIDNFYLSLKTKPFVLLAGISGTGKTKLVQLFARTLNCTPDNGRFKLISVRPDWNDSSDLLGYKNLQGKFVPGPMIDIIKRASEDPRHIYMVCLDEMNLARVEYYFSEFLSKMETRRWQNGEITTDPLFTDKDFEKAEDMKYAGLSLPDNLYIVGTVNMDETTHPFSKKVLDRANTIEFSEVELNSFDLTEAHNNFETMERIPNQFLKPEYLTLKDCSPEDRDLISQVIEDLEEINDILKQANLHVGYRVRDEITFYMLYNRKYSLLDRAEAFDFQLMQKILPRIQGSSGMIGKVLRDLFGVASGKHFEEGVNIGDQAVDYVKNNRPEPYPRSAEKLAYMIKRMEEDRFTAYWL